MIGLAGSSRTASRILIFSIPMEANYSFKFELNINETKAPTFFGHNNSFLVGVYNDRKFEFSNLVVVTNFRLVFR